MNLLPLRCILVLFVTLSTTLRAQSPPAPAAERVVYEAAFYAPFAPRTAFDMVNQTPGFVLAGDEDEEQRRGFSGAVGNVLIDGERPSAKSQSVKDFLQRVPAGEVVRIEILRGGIVGDASGAAVLANVVRRHSAGGGAWGLGTELATRSPAPNGWFSWGGRRGLTDYSIGGNSYAFERDLPGTRVVRDAAGAIIARRESTSPREYAQYELNGQAARALGGGKLAVTGEVGYSRYHDDSTLRTLSPAQVQLENQLVPYSESTRRAEAGVTFTRGVGAWDFETAALATRRRYHSGVRVTHFDAGDARDSEFTQRLARDSGESILRATLARDLSRGRLEAGAEAALNTLDGALALAFDFGAGPSPIEVPNANLTVRERRAEVFVSHAWRIDERWSLESRLAAEASRLEFRGDTRQSASLTYVKPRVQLTRKFGAHQLQARVFRDVGQLDFTDFVSTAELEDEVINGGNPDLKPQTAWAFELDADLRFADAALRVRGFRHFLDDVSDLVPFGPPQSRIDAPGNIGSGTLTGIELSARTPLRWLPGGTLSISGTVQDAVVRDPVTLRHRTISDFPDSTCKSELRQDLGAAKFSWGVSYGGESARVDHRLLERDAHRKSRSLDVFAETSVLGPFKLRLSMLSILGDDELRERRFYAPDRAGTLASSESTRLRPGHWWLLTLSGGF